MKFYLLTWMALILFSCSSECDVSDAEKAADCMCELNMKYGQNYLNENKRKQIEEQFKVLKKRVDEKVSSGAYTLDEVYDKINSRKDCEN
jgi:hypothetical protein